MLEAGISSTRRIAEFWGIARPQPISLALPKIEAAFFAETGPGAAADMLKPKAENLIWRALKAAGLIRR